MAGVGCNDVRPSPSRPRKRPALHRPNEEQLVAGPAWQVDLDNLLFAWLVGTPPYPNNSWCQFNRILDSLLDPEAISKIGEFRGVFATFLCICLVYIAEVLAYFLVQLSEII